MTIGQWLDSFLASFQNSMPAGSTNVSTSSNPTSSTSYAAAPTLDVQDAPQGVQNIDPASSAMDMTSPTCPSQPSLKYPFYPIKPPRVDNKDQPWYGRGPRFGGPAGYAGYDPIVQDSSGNSIGKVSQFWQHLADYWGPDGQGSLDYDKEAADQLASMNTN